jgi:hypothetical protein
MICYEMTCYEMQDPHKNEGKRRNRHKNGGKRKKTS